MITATVQDYFRAYSRSPDGTLERGIWGFSGRTPLQQACAEGDAALVVLLLAAGADPNSVNVGGSTAMMEACRDHPNKSSYVVMPIVKLLLNAGARVGLAHTELTDRVNKLEHALERYAWPDALARATTELDLVELRKVAEELRTAQV